jgi:hypothetical protein
MDNANFKQVMATLAEAYSKNVTPLTAKIYWQALKDFTNEQVENAVIAHLSDPQVCQFWPQAGTLIAKITGTAKQKEISVEHSAMQSWELILQQVRKTGAYGSLKLDDKLALKAVHSIGGWVELCRSPEATLTTWKRKEFMQAYQTLAGATELPSNLPGIGQQSQDKIEAKRVMEKYKNNLQ